MYVPKKKFIFVTSSLKKTKNGLMYGVSKYIQMGGTLGMIALGTTGCFPK